jgi:hypothetical protein
LTPSWSREGERDHCRRGMRSLHQGPGSLSLGWDFAGLPHPARSAIPAGKERGRRNLPGSFRRRYASGPGRLAVTILGPAASDRGMSAQVDAIAEVGATLSGSGSGCSSTTAMSPTFPSCASCWRRCGCSSTTSRVERIRVVVPPGPALRAGRRPTRWSGTDGRVRRGRRYLGVITDDYPSRRW